MGAEEYVGGTSLVRGPNKLPSSAFNHVCLVINYYLNTQRRVTRNSPTIWCRSSDMKRGRNLVMVREIELIGN